MSEHDGPGRPEDVGSVGEEAAKLFGALSGWARDHGGDLSDSLGDLAGHATDAVRGVDEHLATGAAECQWCPVCRTVHALREVSPEVRDHLASAAASLMQAAAGVLAATQQHGSARESGVEHIDLDPEDQA